MVKTRSNPASVLAVLRAESLSLGAREREIDIKIRKLNEERSAVAEKKASIDTTIAKYNGKPPTAAAARRVVTSPTVGPFAGMSIIDAAVKQLRIAKEPQTSREIWAAMGATGFTVAADRPANRVHWELRKRQEKLGDDSDVVLVGGGRWGLRELIPTNDLKKMVRGLGGMAGRDAELHSAKTREGMEALKARGVHIGRKRVMTDAKVLEAERMLSQNLSVDFVAAKLGVSKPAIYFYFTIRRVNGQAVITRKSKPDVESSAEQIQGSLLN